MEEQNVLATAGIVVMLLGAAHHAVTRAAALATAMPSAATDACALLTAAEVSTALGVTSLAGRHPFEGTTTCIWSDDPTASINNRRVTLTVISTASFDGAKSRGSSRVAIVPVSGIGDDAYSDGFKSHESPFLNVRKGASTIQLRVLNGGKLKELTLDEEKAKEADLGKAAAGRL